MAKHRSSRGGMAEDHSDEEDSSWSFQGDDDEDYEEDIAEHGTDENDDDEDESEVEKPARTIRRTKKRVKVVVDLSDEEEEADDSMENEKEDASISLADSSNDDDEDGETTSNQNQKKTPAKTRRKKVVISKRGKRRRRSVIPASLRRRTSKPKNAKSKSIQVKDSLSTETTKPNKASTKASNAAKVSAASAKKAKTNVKAKAKKSATKSTTTSTTATSSKNRGRPRNSPLKTPPVKPQKQAIKKATEKATRTMTRSATTTSRQKLQQLDSEEEWEHEISSSDGHSSEYDTEYDSDVPSLRTHRKNQKTPRRAASTKTTKTTKPRSQKPSPKRAAAVAPSSKASSKEKDQTTSLSSKSKNHTKPREASPPPPTTRAKKRLDLKPVPSPTPKTRTTPTPKPTKKQNAASPPLPKTKVSPEPTLAPPTKSRTLPSSHQTTTFKTASTKKWLVTTPPTMTSDNTSAKKKRLRRIVPTVVSHIPTATTPQQKPTSTTKNNEKSTTVTPPAAKVATQKQATIKTARPKQNVIAKSNQTTDRHGITQTSTLKPRVTPTPATTKGLGKRTTKAPDVPMERLKEGKPSSSVRQQEDKVTGKMMTSTKSTSTNVANNRMKVAALKHAQPKSTSLDVALAQYTKTAPSLKVLQKTTTTNQKAVSSGATSTSTSKPTTPSKPADGGLKASAAPLTPAPVELKCSASGSAAARLLELTRKQEEREEQKRARMKKTQQKQPQQQPLSQPLKQPMPQPRPKPQQEQRQNQQAATATTRFSSGSLVTRKKVMASHTKGRPAAGLSKPLQNQNKTTISTGKKPAHGGSSSAVGVAAGTRVSGEKRPSTQGGAVAPKKPRVAATAMPQTSHKSTPQAGVTGETRPGKEVRPQGGKQKLQQLPLVQQKGQTVAGVQSKPTASLQKNHITEKRPATKNGPLSTPTKKPRVAGVVVTPSPAGKQRRGSLEARGTNKSAGASTDANKNSKAAERPGGISRTGKPAATKERGKDTVVQPSPANATPTDTKTTTPVEQTENHDDARAVSGSRVEKTTVASPLAISEKANDSAGPAKPSPPTNNHQQVTRETNRCSGTTTTTEKDNTAHISKKNTIVPLPSALKVLGRNVASRKVTMKLLMEEQIELVQRMSQLRAELPPMHETLRRMADKPSVTQSIKRQMAWVEQELQLLNEEQADVVGRMSSIKVGQNALQRALYGLAEEGGSLKASEEERERERGQQLSAVAPAASKGNGVGRKQGAGMRRKSQGLTGANVGDPSRCEKSAVAGSLHGSKETLSSTTLTSAPASVSSNMPEMTQSAAGMARTFRLLQKNFLVNLCSDEEESVHSSDEEYCVILPPPC